MRTGVRRAVVLLGVLVVLGCVALAARTRWAAAEDRVTAAAVAGYVAAHPEATPGEVSRWEERDGCALVEVDVPGDPDGVARLVVQRRGPWWVYLGRSSVDLDSSPLPGVCQPGSDLLGDR